MAFSRKEISRDQQGESLLDMSGEPSSAFSGVFVTGFFDQAQDQIVDDGQIASSGTFGHPGRIFSNPRPIEVIIQHLARLDRTDLDPPMSAVDCLGALKVGLDLAK